MTSRRLVPVLSALLVLAGVYPLASVLDLSVPWMATALFVMIFVCGFLLHAIEASVFNAGRVRRRDVAGACALAVVAAVIIALFVMSPSSGTVARHVAGWFADNGTTGAWLRIALSAVSFMVVYNMIGSATWPLVRNYYEDPKYGLNLRVPRGRTVILLQLGRGLLATLALLPVLTSSLIDGVQWWGRLAVAFAMLAAIVPLVSAVNWPVRLRVIHAVEITLFALVQTFAWWKLFA